MLVVRQSNNLEQKHLQRHLGFLTRVLHRERLLELTLNR